MPVANHNPTRKRGIGLSLHPSLTRRVMIIVVTSEPQGTGRGCHARCMQNRRLAPCRSRLYDLPVANHNPTRKRGIGLPLHPSLTRRVMIIVVTCEPQGTGRGCHARCMQNRRLAALSLTFVFNWSNSSTRCIIFSICFPGGRDFQEQCFMLV